MGVRGPGGWMRAFRTPLWLGVPSSSQLLVVFALTPDPKSASGASAPSAEPTPGPHECVVCPIDQRCDAKSGQCMFIDHTPLPCVKTATYDDKAGFCLPGERAGSTGRRSDARTGARPGCRAPSSPAASAASRGSPTCRGSATTTS